MTVLLRPAQPSECSALSALCLRSKAHWGYDPHFLEACRDELTLHPADLNEHLIVAERLGQCAGVARIGPLQQDSDLLLLFVDPVHMGYGIGRVLFDWALASARAMGAKHLMIEADPDAAPFYEKMGAEMVGQAKSLSIPGRMLPLLAYRL